MEIDWENWLVFRIRSEKLNKENEWRGREEAFEKMDGFI
jgi:hypothetical protein